MVEAIRKLVSGNRRRLHEDNFSLDLTYIMLGSIIVAGGPVCSECSSPHHCLASASQCSAVCRVVLSWVQLSTVHTSFTTSASDRITLV